ncbi:MAG: FG-GAP-like repeat-containing protein, partial [Chitinophagaceae bacterium]
PGFVFLQPPHPVIKAISPMSGAIGTIVKISGSGFRAQADSNKVFFGGMRAKIISGSDSVLNVEVPVGATYAPVTVNSYRRTAYSASPFTVTFKGGGFILPTSFEKSGDYVTSESESVGIGDLDGDGKLDVFTPTMLAFRNLSEKGKIQLADYQRIPSISNGNKVTTGDLDGDGRIDIVGTNHDFAPISIFRNTGVPGNISFAPRSDRRYFSTQRYADEVVVHDLNLDGRPDIAFPTDDNGLWLIKNESYGEVISFPDPIRLQTSTRMRGIAVNDFNGDGWPDVAVCNHADNRLLVFKNQSTVETFSFTLGQSMPTLVAPKKVCAGDFDGDGLPDLAVLCLDDSRISIFRNISTRDSIMFAPAVEFQSFYMPGYSLSNYGLGLSDLDGDGKTDMVIVSRSYEYIQLAHNTSVPGSISFDAGVSFTMPEYATDVAIGDLDGDSLPDICVVSNTKLMRIIRNKTNIPHITGMLPKYGGPGNTVELRGFNFDEATEVKFGGVPVASFKINSPNSITAMIGATGGGTLEVTNVKGVGKADGFNYFATAQIVDVAPLKGEIGTPVRITGANFHAVADSNSVYFGAVKAKIITATRNELLVSAPAGATLSPISVVASGRGGKSHRAFSTTFKGGSATLGVSSFDTKLEYSDDTPITIHGADFDNDGRPDLAQSSGSGGFAVYRNLSVSGLIKLDTVKRFAQDHGGVSAILPVDIDQDGRLDIVICLPTNYIVCYRNTSSAAGISFTTAGTFFCPAGNSIAAADLDGDGRQDLVVSTSSRIGFFVMENKTLNGQFIFAKVMEVESGGNATSISVIDFNNDAKPDIVVGYSSTDYVSVFRNTSVLGTILTAQEQKFTVGSGPYYGLSTGDLNNDGMPDIATITRNASTVTILQNKSTANIDFSGRLDLPTIGHPWNLSISDLNGDGFKDLIYIGESGANPPLLQMGIMVNKGLDSLSFLPTSLVALNTTSTLASMDIDGDGKPEILLSSYGPSTRKSAILRNKSNEAKVLPSGTNPVSGDVVSKVFFDTAAAFYNTRLTVQRHYDLYPLTNAATATATLTLYFSQEEFDAYNNHPAHGFNLPSSPSDNSNKSNIRILQFHGFSATSGINSYDSTAIEIDPDDNKIIWNGAARWWEITIDVKGFSGFFVTSIPNAILPSKLISFSGKSKANLNELQWNSVEDNNLATYQIERSENRLEFTKIGVVKASGSGLYHFPDAGWNSRISYYRLKMVELDGNVLFSPVISVTQSGINQKISVYPNPVRDILVISYAVNAFGSFDLFDPSGVLIKKIPVLRDSRELRLSVLDLPNGIYVLRGNGKIKSSVKISISK